MVELFHSSWNVIYKCLCLCVVSKIRLLLPLARLFFFLFHFYSKNIKNLEKKKNHLPDFICINLWMHDMFLILFHFWCDVVISTRLLASYRIIYAQRAVATNLLMNRMENQVYVCTAHSRATTMQLGDQIVIAWHPQIARRPVSGHAER